ncbi:MAG: zf-HC2 domain-containing protein [Actinomycetota bacterium]|nr:zf-HC2 domain-containing protein [Actinomycetota bacterium]
MPNRMTHGEIQELLGAYVVDALGDEAEREAVAEHIRSCDACRAEAEELRRAADRLREERDEWDETSEALWERIQAEVRRRPRGGEEGGRHSLDT